MVDGTGVSPHPPSEEEVSDDDAGEEAAGEGVEPPSHSPHVARQKPPSTSQLSEHLPQSFCCWHEPDSGVWSQQFSAPPAG